MPSGFADFLIDTNILIYAIDSGEGDKHLRAREIIGRLNESSLGVISTQVVGEWLSVALRKEIPGVDRAGKLEMSRRLLDSWHVVDTTSSVVFRAIEGVERYQMQYYDALLWAAARINAIPTILTEDGTDGQTLDGVTFRNPLLEGFDLDLLGPAVS